MIKEIKLSDEMYGFIKVDHSTCCGAANEWKFIDKNNNQRETCVLVPIVISEKPSPQKAIKDAMTEGKRRQRKGEKKIKNNDDETAIAKYFSKWYEYSADYRKKYDSRKFNRDLVSQFNKI